MSSSPDQPTNQSNVQITSAKQKSAQAGVVNLNSMKSFFNARSQGNRSIDKNNASSQGMQPITTSEI